MAQTLSPGTLVLASPPLQEQLEQARSPPPLDMDQWVESVALDYPQCEDPDDEHADENGLLFTSIELYRVRQKLDGTESKKKRKGSSK